LRNVTDGDLGRAKGGIRALHIRERTGLTLLPSTTFEISSILKNHAKRVSNKDKFNPASAILDGTKGKLKRGRDAENVPLAKKSKTGVNLNSLAECIGEPAPSQFLVRCLVENFNPNSNGIGAEFDAKALRNLCVRADENEDWSFQFVIHVADHSAEFDLIVAADPAKDLLGIDPEDLFAKGAKKKAAERDGLKRIKELKMSNVEIKIESFELGGNSVFALADGSNVVMLGKTKGAVVSDDDNEVEDEPIEKKGSAKTPAKKSSKSAKKSAKKSDKKSTKKSAKKSAKKTKGKGKK